MPRLRALILAAALLLIPTVAPARTVPPDDPNLYYVGRFDHRDPAGPRFEWSASSLTIRFHGDAIALRLRDTGNDDYEIVVDGKPALFNAHAGEQTIHSPTDLQPADHEFTLFKRTEAFVGQGQILGIDLPDSAQLLRPIRHPHRIEIIGDSISCGYGDEAPGPKVHFSPSTENAYLAYGAIAARAVDAEYVCIAWSGRTMWPRNTIPAIYDLTLPTDPTSHWNFDAPAPDAVLINLGTNDFARGNPDATQWNAAYATFVRHVRQHYPSAMIYLASGTMMSDTWPAGQQAMTTLRNDLHQIQTALQANGDTRLRLIDFGTQDRAADGLGADYHPSLKTHQKMANKFIAALQADLHWTLAATQP